MSLWRLDGTGIRIQSNMNDISERAEVGVLAFALVKASEPDEIKKKLPSSFKSPSRVSKLVITEQYCEAESGVVLTAADGKEIIIVAGAYPHTLAIDGIVSQPHIFEPEYPLAEYRRISMS